MELLRETHLEGEGFEMISIISSLLKLYFGVLGVAVDSRRRRAQTSIVVATET